MKILSASQIKQADAFTISNEQISSIDLMERASEKVYQWLRKRFDKKTCFTVFCGTGNNGGDGLAVARMLHEKEYPVQVYLLNLSKPSLDNTLNKKRLLAEGIIVNELNSFDALIDIEGVIIDAVLGTGLSKPVTGWVGDIIQFLNEKSNIKVSVDIASGLFSEDNDNNSGSVFKPNYTLTFEVEKLAFKFPENHFHVGHLVVLPIGLNADFLNNEVTPYFNITSSFVKRIYKKGSSFAYKNNFGLLNL